MVDYGKASDAQLETDHGFSIDKDLFDINWYESEKFYVKQTVTDTNSHFDKGDTLGYFQVSMGFATSYKSIGGKIYQRMLARGKMVPQTVDGNWQGMSQMLKISISDTSNSLITNRYIEPESSSGSTSYSTSGTLGLNAGASVKMKNGKLVISPSGSLSLGINSSTSFTVNSLVITTNEEDNKSTYWKYDYCASDNNTQQNAYLFGSSTQYGVFAWNTPDATKLMGSFKVSMYAEFGGGNSKNAEVVEKGIFPKQKPKILGTLTKSKTIQMYTDTTEMVGK